jgi:hypothetical protein
MNESQELHTEFKSVELKGRDHWGDLDVDRKIIFRWFLKTCGLRVWT